MVNVDPLAALDFEPTVLCESFRCRGDYPVPGRGVAVIEYRPEAIADPRAMLASDRAGRWVVCGDCLDVARRPQPPHFRNGLVRVVQTLGTARHGREQVRGESQ